MKTNPNTPLRISILVSALAAFFFVIDISIPLGVAGGVPYVGVVLVSLWAPRRFCVVYAAVLCSVLTVAGYFISPLGGEQWMVLSNRFLALFAVWATAALGMILRRAQAALRISHDELEDRVDRRTMELTAEIAERKRAEADIRKLSRAVEQSYATVIITDIDGAIEYVNPKFTELTGYTFEEVRGKSPGILKSGHTTADEYKRLWETILSGRVWTGELLNKKKDGEYFWELASISPVKDPKGAITNFIAVKEDITERKSAEAALRRAHDELEKRVEERTIDLSEEVEVRKRAEEELKENQLQIRSILDVTSDYIFSISLNPEGQMEVDWITEKFTEMTGWTADDVKRLDKWTDKIHKDDQEGVLDLMQTALKGRIGETELRFISKSGDALWLNLITMPRWAEQKRRVAGIIGAVRDITGRKEGEARIKAALAEKEVLLKEIHHRVKNNLQVVSSILNLQSGYIEDEPLRGVFSESQDRIRSMAMIHERLYLSGDLASIDFAEYVQGLTAMLFRSYGMNASRIELKLDVPECSVDIDTSIQLGLILNELCSNALKHAFPDAASGELRIEARPAEGGLCMLMVSDNGVGLPEGFDIKGGGSMGLELIDSMVAQLGGEIEVDGEDGATFRITFPYPKCLEKEKTDDQS